jgi:hypothetical protein
MLLICIELSLQRIGEGQATAAYCAPSSTA